MFSFVGDTVLDPFGGTGSTTLASSRVGRNSISVELDPEYFNLLKRRLSETRSDLFSHARFTYHGVDSHEAA
jgi:DNA modification methylase